MRRPPQQRRARPQVRSRRPVRTAGRPPMRPMVSGRPIRRPREPGRTKRDLDIVMVDTSRPELLERRKTDDEKQQRGVCRVTAGEPPAYGRHADHGRRQPKALAKTAPGSTNSGGGSAQVRSCACPGVSITSTGLPSASTRAWILVVSPPRERPIACSPFFFVRRRCAGERARWWRRSSCIRYHGRSPAA